MKKNPFNFLTKAHSNQPVDFLLIDYKQDKELGV